MKRVCLCLKFFSITKNLCCLLSFSFGMAIEGLAQPHLALIPQPAALQMREGIFQLNRGTALVVQPAAVALMPLAQYWQAHCRQSAGIDLTISAVAPSSNFIEFALDTTVQGEEAYNLEISPERIRLAAAAPAGMFYALQTLRQLLPTVFEGHEVRQHVPWWPVPCVSIQDQPRFPYRGMHLDVGRHFFPVEFIKKYIDLLAMYKFNRFHWHLTEDQGWRIEIKKYPRLQEVAAWRKETLVGHYSHQPHQFDGKRYGGYYTQDEVREVVRYAAERHITVIPEIEMPGHSLAALAAYPELACTPGPFEPATLWGIFEDVYCPKEETFRFLEDVLTEVMALFPSEYIHIGGDECPKTRWKQCAHCQALMQREGLKDEHELQSYFIRRIERFLNSKGRQIIGWDEILEGGLAPNATVMSWRGVQGGIAAAKEGHHVIMTPTSHCYLDYYQSVSSEEPLAIGGFLPLEKVYAYEPVPAELNAQEAQLILGAQGNVWTEYMPTPEKVEYMAFPRALAIAELNWTPAALKDYHNFALRLVQHFKRLDIHGVNYARTLYDLQYSVAASQPGQALLTLASLHPDGIIRYTTDGTPPTETSPAYSGAISILKPTTLQAAVFTGTYRASSILKVIIAPHLATGASVTLKTPPSPAYNLGGAQALINGIAGSDQRYGDKEWLGWAGQDVEAVISLDKPVTARRVQMRFFQSPGAWIYLPKSIEISVSADGKNWRPAGAFRAFPVRWTAQTFSTDIPLSKVARKARALLVRIERHGIIAEGRQGAGHEAWLFVDEIRVR